MMKNHLSPGYRKLSYLEGQRVERADYLRSVDLVFRWGILKNGADSAHRASNLRNVIALRMSFE